MRPTRFEGRVLVLVYSDDDGRTGSKWRATMIHGSPGYMLGLRDGRIFLTVGTRWAGQRDCPARILDPEGENIDTAPEIIIRDDAISPDCGYPWAVELNDGRVLVTYWPTSTTTCAASGARSSKRCSRQQLTAGRAGFWCTLAGC